MRILFITHYFYPEGNAPATRIHELTRRWADEGHDVTVLTAAPNVPSGVVYEGYKNRWRHEELIDGVRVIRVWTYLAANAGTKRRIASYISFMLTAFLAGLGIKRPDVVVATSPQFFCGWAGRLVSAVRRLPFVLEIRDIWPESIVAVGAMDRSRVIRLLERLEHKLYAGADHIVTVGPPYRDKLHARGVDESAISVIPNGVDLAKYNSETAAGEFRRQYGLEGRFVCAYVGTIGMASGLDVAIRAGKLLRDEGRDDICIVLVGDGAERARLEAEVSQAGLRNVVLTGRLPKEQVPAALAGVDVCLVHLLKTDLFEAVIPSKIFEAAAMRRPIVLGVGGYVADLVSSFGAGICIEPENEAELVSALKHLADNPDAARAMGTAGRELVSRSYNYDLLAVDYIARLTELLNGR